MREAHQTYVSAEAAELKSYLEVMPINEKSNPLEYWRNHKTIYPKLARLAQHYCGVVATSVPSEQLFSQAGYAYSDRRSKLSPHLLDKMVILQANKNVAMKLLNIKQLE